MSQELTKNGRDFVIVAACIAGIAGIGFALEGNVSRDLSEHLVVATVVQASDNVSLREPSSLVWNTTLSGRGVRDGDSVFTGEGGFATLLFSDGSQVRLGEKTLFVVKVSGATMSGRIRGGRVRAEVSSDFVFEANGIQARADANSIVALASATDGLEVFVEEGHAKVADDSIRTGEGAIATASGVQKLARTARLFEPANSAVIAMAEDTQAVNFRWRASSSTFVQISRSHHFENLVVKTSSAGGHLLLTLDAPGTYYWRVVDTNDEPISETRTVTLAACPSIARLTPAHQTTLLVRPGTTLPISWTRGAGDLPYDVEVSRDPLFSTPRAKTTHHPHVEFEGDFAEGDYFWRIRARVADTACPYQPIQRFRLIREPLPAAPELEATEYVE